MKLIDGKKIAAEIKHEIAKEVAEMIDRGEKSPHLAAILVGEDPPSQTYIASKEKACHEVGIISSSCKCRKLSHSGLIALTETVSRNQIT